MELSRSIVIARRVEEVFAFVADPRHDPQWCKKVKSVDQVAGAGPGEGARYRVVHRPVPFRPERSMDYTCVSLDPPRRLEWRENDGVDVITVIYELETVDDGTRLTQHDRAELGAPRFFHPFMRIGIGHDVGSQLKALKRLLEGGTS
jgi:uncharacterized protein YndB with AHSA1/START domain